MALSEFDARIQAEKLAKTRAAAERVNKARDDAAKASKTKDDGLKEAQAEMIAKENAAKAAAAAAFRTKSNAPSGAAVGSSPFAPLGTKAITEYTVKKGDTLSQIAKDFYGVTGPKYWNLIQSANKDLIKDVNLIKPGQVFKIPELPVELKKK